MSNDAPHLSPADRTLAEALLRRAPYAYVAMVENARPDGSAGPYVVPMNFAYEPIESPAESLGAKGCLYVHSGEGRKSDTLAKNPRVCVAVTADAAFDQGTSPCDDGFSFRSVLVEGRATLLEDRDQREEALRAIVAKYDPDAASLPFAEDALGDTLVFAITIESLSYKALPRRGTR